MIQSAFDNVTAMRTQSGQSVSLGDPWKSHLCICDIAHGLSHLCRFAGQSRRFYSVAQHSVLVSQMVPTMPALLHDAHEYLMGDIPRPVKDYLRTRLHSDALDKLEARLADGVLWRFTIPLNAAVKAADDAALALERRDLFDDPPRDDIPEHVAHLRIRPVAPWRARRMFLRRFLQLGGMPCEQHWRSFVGPPRLWGLALKNRLQTRLRRCRPLFFGVPYE